MIKKGDMVEYSDDYHWNYTLGGPFAKYGVACEDEKNNSIRVEIADGTFRTIPLNKTHAYAWAGWIPEDLESVWEKYNPEIWNNEDEY